MSNGTAPRIADIYARSLLDLADQARAVQTIEADFDALSILLRQEVSFQAFLASPAFAEQTKRDLIHRVFAGKLHDITLNFLYVAIDHDRGELLPEIVDRCKQRCREHQGFRAVRVTVAQAMNDGQCDKLTRDLADAMKARIDLDVHVDPSIIGGAIIRYGDRMLDNSVKGRLTRAISYVTDARNRRNENV